MNILLAVKFEVRTVLYSEIVEF